MMQDVGRCSNLLLDDVTERLDHGSLDLAVLLTPVDTTKYEYLSLPDSARWGLLLPESSVLAGKAGV